MKQKAGIYKPIFAVLAIALAALCVIVYFTDIQRFYIAVSIAGVAAFAAVLMMLGAEADAERFAKRMGESIGEMQSDALRAFPMPIVVASSEGEIIWYNPKSAEMLFADENWYGRPVSELLGENVKTENISSVTFRDRRYTVFSVHAEHENNAITAYYLVDDTELKCNAELYAQTRPSIWMVMIDSLDEVLQSAKENERSQLLSKIEYQIEKFIGDYDGLIIKKDRDRFVAVVEERHMQEIVSKRFALLDAVRSLNGSEQLPVTLSIGLARNVDNFPEGEQAARQALDMAQGRGGDQVAVKTQAGYDFYGGISKGIEKRTKVKTRIIATALAELIASSSNVVIMGHKFADLDCLGAAVGLMHPIRQMGKPCVVAINRQRNLVSSLIERLEHNGYENSFLNPSDVLPKIGQQTLLIVVDTHLEHVLESSDVYRACKNVVVIDHHRRMVGYIDNAVVFYHEPYASSASEMVTEMVQYFGSKNRITRVEAEALLAGIMLDTRNFVIRTGVRTFEAAAYLRRQGADTVEVRKLFSSTMESYQRRSRVVSSAEVYHRCAIACTGSMTEDIKIVAPQAADELLSISDVDASFVLYEYDGGISISARSMGKFNVQVIMEALGGGGHQTMAATQMPDASMEDARQKLLEAIEEYESNNKKTES